MKPFNVKPAGQNEHLSQLIPIYGKWAKASVSVSRPSTQIVNLTRTNYVLESGRKEREIDGIHLSPTTTVNGLRLSFIAAYASLQSVVPAGTIDWACRSKHNPLLAKWQEQANKLSILVFPNIK